MLGNNLNRGRRYKKSGKREEGRRKDGRMDLEEGRTRGWGSKEEREIQNYTNQRHAVPPAGQLHSLSVWAKESRQRDPPHGPRYTSGFIV